MEYTESLPPPPGTHEAWPTKPRSVSHWAGLAGLKAGGLSAGRPGRLRTLDMYNTFYRPRTIYYSGVRHSGLA